MAYFVWADCCLAEEVVASGHFASGVAECTDSTRPAARTTYCTIVAAASTVCIPDSLGSYLAEIVQHRLVGFDGKSNLFVGIVGYNFARRFPTWADYN